MVRTARWICLAVQPPPTPAIPPSATSLGDTHERDLQDNSYLGLQPRRWLRAQRRTVSEADIVTFAGISGDWNPLHIDEEFSKNAGYGGRIAHGPMSMSMAIELMAQQNLIDGTALALLGFS